MRNTSSPLNRSSTVSGAAIQPLTRLPVFLDLDTKRALVVGGSDAAAWKAELLAMAGASVEVFCWTAGKRMSWLLAREDLVGSIRRSEALSEEEVFAGATLAVVDAADDDEAEMMFGAAKNAGVPVNIIDRPAYCDFEFGSIVNRSPIVVGISTSGGAPILGQAIRCRIETLLPPALAEWGRLALRLRSALAEWTKPGFGRRRFWESFAERALRDNGTLPERDDDMLLDIGEIFEAPGATGRITPVDTGFGNAEQLTLKAIRVLQSADMIVFDEGVAADILELARREAQRVLVGKQDCCEAINASIVAMAKNGKHVVWLKSGYSAAQLK